MPHFSIVKLNYQQENMKHFCWLAYSWQ